MTSSGLPYLTRASSASFSMYSTSPWRTACLRRSSIEPSRQVRSTSRFDPAPDTDFANSQSFCRVGPPVEDDILDELEQILGDVLVDHQLTRVDDAHVQPRPDRVVEERGMDRLAHAVVAAEREGEVGDA